MVKGGDDEKDDEYGRHDVEIAPCELQERAVHSGHHDLLHEALEPVSEEGDWLSYIEYEPIHGGIAGVVAAWVRLMRFTI